MCFQSCVTCNLVFCSLYAYKTDVHISYSITSIRKTYVFGESRA